MNEVFLFIKAQLKNPKLILITQAQFCQQTPYSGLPQFFGVTFSISEDYFASSLPPYPFSGLLILHASYFEYCLLVV